MTCVRGGQWCSFGGSFTITQGRRCVWTCVLRNPWVFSLPGGSAPRRAWCLRSDRSWAACVNHGAGALSLVMLLGCFAGIAPLLHVMSAFNVQPRVWYEQGEQDQLLHGSCPVVLRARSRIGTSLGAARIGEYKFTLFCQFMMLI